MRVAIREQLAALVIFALLVGLAIISIPTWIYVRNFVVDVESDSLSLTASLKASRIASQLDLIQAICQTIATRILLQQSFTEFYSGNRRPLANARTDLESAMSSGGLTGLLQARLYSSNSTGNPQGLLNVTGSGVGNQTANIELPYLSPDGSKVNLSDTDFGYPPSLYPNITYQDLGHPSHYDSTTPAFAANVFPGVRLSDNGGLVLGPLAINESFALISVTIPVKSLNILGLIIGYITFVVSAGSLIDVQTSREGLGSTGMVLLVGPADPSNRFNKSLLAHNATYSPPKDALASSPMYFVLPIITAKGQRPRHSEPDYDEGGLAHQFALSQYPTLFDAYYRNTSHTDHAISALSTTNEQGASVAVGVARPASALVDWAVIVEKSAAEASGPIDVLRKILLGCVFGTVGLVTLLIFPCAHLSVLPVRRLKSATEKSIAPPGYEDEFNDDFSEHNSRMGGTSAHNSFQLFNKDSFKSIWGRIKEKNPAPSSNETYSNSRRRGFKIPSRVPEKKHYITDELTELTGTFNEMTDELLKQYTSLDEKVAERTQELELSKRAAEAANESKTLFIANISHELKTPLNGIMGMCAVCMEEDDVVRIKQSLKTLYRSGDLLLHLLEDLLSFSKNQIDQHVSLEERDFSLNDIRSQLLSIFDKQVRESGTAFRVAFVESSHLNLDLDQDPNSLETKFPGLGPSRLGRLKNIYLWGDQHRILQVIINLVSNSLKFTPRGGKVELRIRCMGEMEQFSDDTRVSSSSRNGSATAGRSGHRAGSSSMHSASSRATGTPATPLKGYTALSINPMEPKTAPRGLTKQRSGTQPPASAKTYMFEFEVEDTGLGIAEHMQDKIFEPFVQADLGLSKKYGGTGLGLSICSQLAKLMGGNITLASTVGVGSTFTMQIPLKHIKDRAPSTASSSTKSRRPSLGSVDGDNQRNSVNSTGPEQKATSASNVQDKQPRLVGLSAPFFAAEPSPNSAKDDPIAAIDQAIANNTGPDKLRVLVADDNATNVEVVSRMLKLEDVCDVTIAKDGQEAYDLVKAKVEKNQRFDLIFMDIQMPNLDGLQSTRLIRKMGYAAPIVALTAFSEESNVKACIESGMDEFLSKPIRRVALKNVLQKFATIPEEPATASSMERA